jgi:hypothetical protein
MKKRIEEIKNEIAYYFGFVPKQKRDDALAGWQKANETVSESLELVEQFKTTCQSQNELLSKFIKPAPVLKPDVLQIIETLKELTFAPIGTIQDEHVYIIMFANAQEMYYLHTNFDGEYIALLKQVNNQNIKQLCKIISEPNRKVIDARAFLETASEDLETERVNLEIKSNIGQTQEFNELTDKEKQTLFVMKRAIVHVRKASVLLRDSEK